MYKLFLFLFLCSLSEYHCARILAVFPMPSISHQVVFRPIIQELVKRGHEVVVITPNPAFSKEDRPENLTEIDVHDVSYKIRSEKFIDNIVSGDKRDNNLNQIKLIYGLVTELFELQMKTKEVQNIIKKKTKPFDLILAEALVLPILGFSDIFKVPVIQITSFLPLLIDIENIGAPDHPFLYPTIRVLKINDFSIKEKMKKIFMHFFVKSDIKCYDEVIKRIFGSDTPPLTELYNNIDMLFLNTFPIWDSNRPMPPSVQYLGGIHVKPIKELPQDLNSYLNSSKLGVIYVSFGTNIKPSILPPEKIQTLINVLSRLPYDIIWKWDKEEMPGRSKNVKISKWLPQSDLLRHPKMKLFLTQGGLQSTDEAILAGVPLLGIPMFGDQWYNCGMYVKHKIGLMIEMGDLNENNLRRAINTLTKDDTYRQNIEKFRAIIFDQPQTPLERAVWWTEHVLRHGGARHLRSPAANMPWTQYYEIELVTYLLAGLVVILIMILLLIRILLKFVIRMFSGKKKNKTN